MATPKIRKKSRPITWIVFYVMLPVLFAVILAVIVLQIIGFNVVGKVTGQLQKVPVVRHVLGEAPIPVPVPLQVANLRIELKGKTNQTSKLQSQVKKLQSELLSVKGSLQTVESELKQTTAKLLKVQQIQVQITQQATIYSNMSSGQAAQILGQLPFNTQVLTLKAMNPSDQASILSKMSTKLAAKLLQAGA